MIALLILKAHTSRSLKPSHRYYADLICAKLSWNGQERDSYRETCQVDYKISEDEGSEEGEEWGSDHISAN